MNRATSFGSAAEDYEASRPGYPVEAADFVLGLTGVSRAVEVGAGTGKTTEAFAREGLEITAIEPDPAMAAVLEAKRLTWVTVVVDSLEDWPGPDGPVDLVFGGQVWHWLDRDTSGRRVMEWLRPGGVVAMIWNVLYDRYGPFTEVYRRHAPHLLEDDDERIRRRDSRAWTEDLARWGFSDVRLTTFDWTAELSPSQVRSLYASYSDHIALDPEVRERVLDGIAGVVAASGAPHRIGYETRVFTGTRP